MKRTEIMAHAMQNLGSPLYTEEDLLEPVWTDLDSLDTMLGYFYTDELAMYFHPKQLPIWVRDYSGDFFYIYKSFEDIKEKLPNTKIYPDDDLYQSDGLHFRLGEYKEGKF